jgi:hypothetical protein
MRFKQIPLNAKIRWFPTRTGGDGARESILIPMNPRSRAGATALVKGYAMDASMAAFFWRRGRRLDFHDQKLLFPGGRDFGLVPAGPVRVSAPRPAARCARSSPSRGPPRPRPRSGRFAGIRQRPEAILTNFHLS